ncbi:MAG: major facilitator superfamily domain-containing protein [Monoraphidium minutum]|nr:MAG: major facilitator superfamily domain-containing protein [Monoraphidium minutum]
MEPDKSPGGRLVVHISAECSSVAEEGDSDEAAPDAPAACEPAACEQRGLTYDQALEQYVGGLGRGQIINFVLAALTWLPGGVLVLLLVFSLGSPAAGRDWECTDASDAACAAALAGPAPAAALCELERGQWRWTRPGDTLVAQFDLICHDAWKAQVANSFFFVGYGLGAGAFGQLSDRAGRKACMFSATAISALFTAAGAVCRSYWPWLVMRLLAGVGAAGSGLGAYVLATEAIGARWRGAFGILSQLFFIGGEFLLVVVSVLFTTWRAQAAATAVLCASLMLLWPLLPESGRWLLAHGRADEAMKVLERLARLNGTRPPGRPLAAGGGGGGAGGGAPAPRLTLWMALRDWHIARRFWVLSFAWAVMCLAYYGISFALGSLGGSLRASFMLSAAAELPSYLLAAWAIDRWGRHNTMACFLLLGGAGCAGCGLAAGGGRMALAALGKLGVSGAFAIASIYTSELFPTLIRTSVLGAENQAARVGAIAAPFIILAGEAGGGDAARGPFLAMGGAALLAGLLVFTLPETLGTPLPDTMEDMGAIASIFTNKTLKRHGFRAAAASMFKTRVRLAPAGSALGPARGANAAPAAAPDAAPRPWRWRPRTAGKAGPEASLWEEDEEGSAEGTGGGAGEDVSVRAQLEALAAPAGRVRAASPAPVGAGSSGGASATAAPADGNAAGGEALV